MSTARLEAFSDGVLAIIITIMVLELRVPHEPTLGGARRHRARLRELRAERRLRRHLLEQPKAGAAYHHLFQLAERVSGGVLWANLHLLFWLSLVPFVTAWMGENGVARIPVAAYAVVLLMCGAAFNVLQVTILRVPDANARLRDAIRVGTKEKLSVAAYALAIPMALFVSPWMAGALFVAVAAMWLVPDPRIERAVADAQA